MLHAWLATLSAIVAAPGPLDAYRANRSAVAADVRYEFHSGPATVDPGDGRNIWAGKRPEFTPTPSGTILGRWACYGGTELFEIHPDPNQFATRPVPKVGLQSGYEPMPIEALYDGKNFAHHTFAFYPGARDRAVVDVLDADAINLVTRGAGPFNWINLFPLENTLARHFPAGATLRKSSMMGGHPTEVEIYQAVKPENGSLQVDIHYDPSIGHLPRYIRWVSRFRKRAFVGEHFLVDARACRAGGFIPTDWYHVGSTIANFDDLYPAFGPDHDGPLTEGRSNMTVDQFHATEVKDRNDAVAMEQVGMIRIVEGLGNTANLARPPKSLTLPEIRRILGPERPAAALPPVTVSEGEKDRYALREESSGRRWIGWAGLAVAVAVAASVAGCGWFRRRKGRSVG